jgi:NAD(P)-dependent dehydrogenase (short-subunit alcohol dehydrogenase family)
VFDRKAAAFNRLLEGLVVRFGLVRIGARELRKRVIGSVALAKISRERGGVGRLDVSREEEVRAMFRNVIEEFGTIDILVSNAPFMSRNCRT